MHGQCCAQAHPTGLHGANRNNKSNWELLYCKGGLAYLIEGLN